MFVYAIPTNIHKIYDTIFFLFAYFHRCSRWSEPRQGDTEHGGREKEMAVLRVPQIMRRNTQKPGIGVGYS